MKNGFIDQYVEEESSDLMCMFDGIPYFNYLPEYDQYDDNYVLQTQAIFTEQPKTSLEDVEI